MDSSQYFVQIRYTYFRMGRRNLDGYRMYYNPDLLADLFDAKEVFDLTKVANVVVNGGIMTGKGGENSLNKGGDV